MLVELAVRDLGRDRGPAPRPRPGHDRPHRRDRGGQDAGRRGHRAAGRRPGRPGARPARCRGGRRGRAVPGRADASGEDEVVLARVVPAEGRSPGLRRTAAWPPSAALAEWGERLVDLHGQHAHQSLLAPAVQRDRPRPLRGHRPRPPPGGPGPGAIHRRRAGRPRRRRPGPRPGDRPAALPGGRAGRGRHRRPRRGRAAGGRGGRCWPTPSPTGPRPTRPSAP